MSTSMHATNQECFTSPDSSASPVRTLAWDGPVCMGSEEMNTSTSPSPSTTAISLQQEDLLSHFDPRDANKIPRAMQGVHISSKLDMYFSSDSPESFLMSSDEMDTSSLDPDPSLVLEPVTIQNVPSSNDMEDDTLPSDTPPILASAEEWSISTSTDDGEMISSLLDAGPSTAIYIAQEPAFPSSVPASSTGTYQPSPDATLPNEENGSSPDIFFQVRCEAYEWATDLPCDDANPSRCGLFIPIGSMIHLHNPQEQIILTPELLSLFSNMDVQFAFEDEYRDRAEGIYIPDFMIYDLQPPSCQSKPDIEDINLTMDGDCLVTAVVGGKVVFNHFSEWYTQIEQVKDTEYMFTVICLLSSCDEAMSELDFVEVDDGGEERPVEKRVRFAASSVVGKVDKYAQGKKPVGWLSSRVRERLVERICRPKVSSFWLEADKLLDKKFQLYLDEIL